MNKKGCRKTGTANRYQSVMHCRKKLCLRNASPIDIGMVLNGHKLFVAIYRLERNKQRKTLVDVPSASLGAISIGEALPQKPAPFAFFVDLSYCHIENRVYNLLPS